jgi:hypothetical protein
MGVRILSLALQSFWMLLKLLTFEVGVFENFHLAFFNRVRHHLANHRAAFFKKRRTSNKSEI